MKNSSSIRRPTALVLIVAGALAGSSLLDAGAQQPQPHPSPAASGKSPALSEHLKPLEPFLGTFSAEFTDENGQTVKARFMCTTEAGGSILIGKASAWIGEAAEPSLSSVDVFYWQPESRAIGMASFGSPGVRSHGVLSQQGGKYVCQPLGYDAQGKVLTKVAEIEWLDRDTFVYQESHVIVGGVVVPGAPKVTWRRVKP